MCGVLLSMGPLVTCLPASLGTVPQSSYASGVLPLLGYLPVAGISLSVQDSLGYYHWLSAQETQSWSVDRQLSLLLSPHSHPPAPCPQAGAQEGPSLQALAPLCANVSALYWAELIKVLIRQSVN
jgi:hypothetical protein